MKWQKPTHERGELCRLHASVADWEAFSCFTAVTVMNEWGEPVSSSATSSRRVVAVGPLCTSTFAVNDGPSTVMMLLVRHGPCTGIGGRRVRRRLWAAVLVVGSGCWRRRRV